jgi:hypothetical protein
MTKVMLQPLETNADWIKAGSRKIEMANIKTEAVSTRT